MSNTAAPPSVAVVGGGLAGIVAAGELAQRGCRVTLFEQRKTLGGRASSFRDPNSGRWLDHGRHVVLGCCTNMIELIRRVGLTNCFETRRTIPFVDRAGRVHRFTPSRWLPAPLHLWPALRRLKLLPRAERLAAARTMWRLARRPPGPGEVDQSIETWLRWRGESDESIERFWEPLLISALSESLDRASVPAARQVCRDGLLTARGAADIHVPVTSLHEVFDRRLGDWLRTLGADVRTAVRVDRVEVGGGRVVDGTCRAQGLSLGRDRTESFDFVVLAVPWYRVRGLLPAELLAWMPQLAGLHRFEPAPITAVHLWYDQPITPLEMAVLPGRLSQWLFRIYELPDAVHYQVLISASHELAGRPREEIAQRVIGELRELGADARSADPIRWRVSTSPTAVFSPRPGLDEHRPPQTTQIPNLMLAGDWTATGWPSTLESAARSGRRAAEAVLDRLGRPERLVVDDLAPGRLARWLLR